MRRITGRRRTCVALLAPIVVASVVGALFVPWHAASSLDSRTHIEMIRGITRHGLPYLENGPVGRFPELQAAWNFAHDGKLWGTYPPLFPYLAAPLFAVAGLRAVSAFSFALVALLAIGVYALGARYSREPYAGVAAAYVTLFATPTSTSALDIGPYMLCVVLLVWAAYFALCAIDAREKKARDRSAFAAGLAGALSSATHLVTFPMAAALLFALFVLPVEGEPPLFGKRGPTPSSLRRLAAAALGACPPLLALSALNMLRFGSPNPISYGPCAWARCVDTGLGRQSAANMLAYAAPVVAVLFAAAVVIYLTRRRKYVPWIALGAALVVLAVPGTPIHAHAAGLGTIATGYLVDVTGIPMAPMVPSADGLGVFWGPFVIKSTLQSTPIFGVALAAPFAMPERRARILVLGLPVLALFATLAMRAVIPFPVHALGFPWLYMRYAMPAWPLLVVLAIDALRDLPWTRTQIVGIAVAAAAGAYVLAHGNDLTFPRRFVALRLSLLLAAAGAVVLCFRRRGDKGLDGLQMLTAAAAIVTACAVTCGVDLRATYEQRFLADARVDMIARRTPERLALVGYGGPIDIPLTLRATRDLEYADLLEAKDEKNFRQLIDRWASERRPIFALWPEGSTADGPWPDVTYELVDETTNLYLITKH